jgi:hypothetical protein
MTRAPGRDAIAPVGEIFLLSLAAALNPTLLAAATLMLVLPNPKKLLLYYLCGAVLTSVTIGCVIVFGIGGESSGTSTAEHTINPIWDVVLGAVILVVAFIVGTGRDTGGSARSPAARRPPRSSLARCSPSPGRPTWPRSP